VRGGVGGFDAPGPGRQRGRYSGIQRQEKEKEQRNKLENGGWSEVRVAASGKSAIKGIDDYVITELN
jgi:hypothetical protein